MIAALRPRRRSSHWLRRCEELFALRAHHRFGRAVDQMTAGDQ